MTALENRFSIAGLSLAMLLHGGVLAYLYYARVPLPKPVTVVEMEVKKAKPPPTLPDVPSTPKTPGSRRPDRE